MNPEESDTEETVKLPWHAHAISGWPLILIFVGGAIGGGCGGLAYGVSITIIKKMGPSFVSYIITLFIGFAGIAMYFGVIIAIAIAFPDLFNK